MTTETGSQDMSEILLLDEDDKQAHEEPPLATRKSRRRVIDDDVIDKEEADQSGPTQVTQFGSLLPSPDPEEHSVHAEKARDITENSLKYANCVESTGPTTNAQSDKNVHDHDHDFSVPAGTAGSTDTQHYSGVESESNHSACPNLGAAATNNHDVSAASDHGDFEWHVNEARPAGTSDAVGDYTLFPRLETADNRVIFQPSDSFRCGKSVMTFLGVTKRDDQLQLLCFSSQKGSVAKTVPLRQYQRVANGESTPLCQAALSQWVRAQTSGSKVSPDRERQRTKFFEEPTLPPKPRKTRAPRNHKTQEVNSRKRKSNLQAAPVKKKPKIILCEPVPNEIEQHEDSANVHHPHHCGSTLSAIESVPPVSFPPSINPSSANPDLYLRLLIGESQLQRLRHQIFADELHAHEENQRLQHLLMQRQVEEAQDGWALLQAMYLAQQKK